MAILLTVEEDRDLPEDNDVGLSDDEVLSDFEGEGVSIYLPEQHLKSFEDDGPDS